MEKTIEVRRIAVYSGHSGSVYALASAGPDAFFSGSGDQVVARWDINGNAPGQSLVRTPHIVYALLLSPDSRHLLVGQSAGGIHVINLDAKKEERLLQYHDAPIFHLEAAFNHGICFSLAGDGMLGVIRTSDWKLMQKLRLSESKLRASALSPDQNLLAVGIGDGTIAVYELPTMKLHRRWQAHPLTYSVNALAFTPDGSLLFSGSRDAHLNVYNVNMDFMKVQSIPAHNYAIYSIVFSPDGTLFATGSRDKTVKIWNTDTMEMLFRIDKAKNEGHLNSVNKVIWHQSGKLITAGDDRSIMVWEIDF